MSPGNQSTSIKKSKYLANVLAPLSPDPSNRLLLISTHIEIKLAKVKNANIYLKLKVLKLFKKNQF